MDEKIPHKQYSGGVLHSVEPFSFAPVITESSAEFQAALQQFSLEATTAAAAMGRIARFSVDPGKPINSENFWHDDKMDIPASAVRRKPKRVNMRGFTEVEL